MQPRKRHNGFSLLEVLVAMAIFAIIGLSANQMLRTVIDTNEATRSSTDAFQAMVRAQGVIARDFSQMVPRGIRDEYGEFLPPLLVDLGPYPIEFTRTGWNNPAGVQRSNMQRVAYEVTDGKLERHFWLVLDRAEDSEPISQVLLTDVEDLRISLVTVDGLATSVWPEDEANGLLPAAIELVISSESIGEVRRVFTPPGTPQVIQRGPEGEGSGGEDDEDTGSIVNTGQQQVEYDDEE